MDFGLGSVLAGLGIATAITGTLALYLTFRWKERIVALFGKNQLAEIVGWFLLWLVYVLLGAVIGFIVISVIG